MKWIGIALISILLFSCLTTEKKEIAGKSKVPSEKIVNISENKKDTLNNNESEDSKLLPKIDDGKIENINSEKGKPVQTPELDKDIDVSTIAKKENKNTAMVKTKKLSDAELIRHYENLSLKNFESKYNLKKLNKTQTKQYKENDKTDIKQTNPVKEEIYSKNLDLTNYDQIQLLQNDKKEAEVKENDEINISLEKPDWIIKSISPDLLKLKKRDNLPNNTSFQFKSGQTGDVKITFLRYDADENKILEQNYTVRIKPRDLFEDNKKQTAKVDVKKQQPKTEKKKTDFKKVLADELFAQKKYPEAKTRYNSLLEEGKVDADIYYKLGIIEEESGNDAAALDNFQKNIKEKDNPNFADALTEIMKLLKKQKKFNEAVDVFYNYAGSENITAESKEELYLLLSDVYFSMNDFVNAASEYRRFIGNYPNSIDLDKALFYLAYSLENYIMNPDFKESYRIYKIIVAEYPESKYYQLSKNRMLFLERHFLKVN
jgi:hypothetical protein